MMIKTIIAGPFETNCYIVHNEINKSAILIDAPPQSFEEVNEFLSKKNLNLEYLILTHGHIDHIADANKFKTNFNTKILMHRNDLFWIHPPDFMLNLVNNDYTQFDVDIILNGEEIINSALGKFKILHTPGHTQGGICIYFEKDNILFTGDTLFQESVGRVDLPGGSMDSLIKSIIEKLFTLPNETIVYPGHGDSTNIINEKKFNPYLKNNGDKK